MASTILCFTAVRRCELPGWHALILMKRRRLPVDGPLYRKNPYIFARRVMTSARLSDEDVVFTRRWSRAVEIKSLCMVEYCLDRAVGPAVDWIACAACSATSSAQCYQDSPFSRCLAMVAVRKSTLVG